MTLMNRIFAIVAPYIVTAIVLPSAFAQSPEVVKNSTHTIAPSMTVSGSDVHMKLSAQTTSAAQLAPTVPPIVGNFYGICNGDDMWTEFKLDDDGHLVGRYSQKSDGGYDGTLSECQMITKRDFGFVWRDKFGWGNLKITFDSDYRSFDGRWTTGKAKSSGRSWTGVRE